MKKIGDYQPINKMHSLIANDYRFLQVLSRFGISLGFGDKTIKEVCDSNGVDCNTFLAVVNFINNQSVPPLKPSPLSIDSLLHYLKQSHQYFIEFLLPSIRRKLLDGIIMRDSDVSFLIIRLFDEYMEGVAEHMKEEEATLFNAIEKRHKSDIKPGYTQTSTELHHSKVGEKLTELKNIILKYCPADSKTNLLNAALYDIYRCEEELTSHCLIEDLLLLPAFSTTIATDI